MTRKIDKSGDESLFESIILGTTDVIYAKDTFGRYLFFNAGCEQVTGKSAGDVLGKDDFYLFPHEAAKTIIAVDQRVMQEKTTFIFEENMTNAKGEVRVLHNTKNPLLDKEGKVIGIFGIARDITDQKAAQDALKDSEEKFRLLYSSMSQGLALHEIITDDQDKPVDYVFLDINESYTRLFGSTKEQVMGRRITEVMPKVEPYWIEVFGKVAQTGIPYYYENYLETTGRYYSTYTYSPKKNQFAVIVDDITKRKEIEEKLIESEQQFKALFESSGTGVAFYNPNGTVISYNRIAAENMGGEPDDFAGKSIYELFPKKNAELYFNRIKKAMQSDNPLEYEDEVPLPTGNRYFSSAFTRILNLEGAIQGVQIISTDISIRKQMEIALRESEQRFINLYEKAPLGYQSLNENGCFVEVNQTWLNMLGYKKDEVVGQWFGDFLAPEYVEAFRERFPLFIKLGAIHSEFIMKHKDGTRLFIAFDGQIGHKIDGSFDKTYCI
ncbi:MAG: PAS domain S-box protein, partial [Erysipelotrichaceae bacterium]